MRILTLPDQDYQELKLEDLGVLGDGGYLFPPFGQRSKIMLKYTYTTRIVISKKR